jgi:hypothetical protein
MYNIVSLTLAGRKNWRAADLDSHPQNKAAPYALLYRNLTHKYPKMEH